MSDLLHEYQNLYYQAMALTALVGVLTCALIACSAFLFRKPKEPKPHDYHVQKWMRRWEGNE